MTSLNRDSSKSPTALLSLRAMNLSSPASTSPAATQGGSGGVEREMSPGRCSSSGSGGGAGRTTPNVVTTSSFIKVERPLSPMDVASGMISGGQSGVGIGSGTLSSSSSGGLISSMEGDASALVALGVGGPVLCKYFHLLFVGHC